MLDDLLRFVNERQLVRPGDRVLLAVSGGIDSVVMCELFSRAGFGFGIAHCNFRLRGEESNGDELFVKELADHYGAPFFVKGFDTQATAEEHNVSIQVAARRLRYEWFEELRKKESYTSIATAHQRNDEVETFFINLVRGTGIAGLRGIPARNGNIIRPLLFALRSEIEAFARSNDLLWREDSSNLSSTYLRNKIRQSVIPALKEIEPGIENILSADIRRITEAVQIMSAHIDEKRKELVKEENGYVFISLDGLKQLQPIHTYLFELLKPYNFREPVVHDIASALDAEPGKRFYSSTHLLVKDRTALIISPIEKEDMQPVLIYPEQEAITDPFPMLIKTRQRNSITSLKAPPSVAYLDRAKLQFPLLLRKWEQGDYFCPLGMKHRKKLSDFFIDNKFPLAQKENTWVLVSGGDIVWIVGVRVDDRYKITAATQQVLSCELAKLTK